MRSDDGTVTVEGVAPLVRFGDRAAPEAFKAWFQRPDASVVAMLVERVAGKYECTGIQIGPAPGGMVTREALRAVALPALVRTAVAHATHVVLDIDSAWGVGSARLLWVAGEPLEDEDGEWMQLDDDEFWRQVIEPVAPEWLVQLSPTLPDFRLGDAVALPALGPTSRRKRSRGGILRWSRTRPEPGPPPAALG